MEDGASTRLSQRSTAEDYDDERRGQRIYAALVKAGQAGTDPVDRPQTEASASNQ